MQVEGGWKKKGRREEKKWMEKYKEGSTRVWAKATREQPKAKETKQLCSYGFLKFSK